MPWWFQPPYMNIARQGHLVDFQHLALKVLKMTMIWYDDEEEFNEYDEGSEDNKSENYETKEDDCM